MTPPMVLKIPMSQYSGASVRPLVSVGDRVLRGEKIGEAEGGVGCPVHSSVSGRVREMISSADGSVSYIVIENDGAYELHPSVMPFEKKLTDTGAEEIIEIIKNAGISGMGGALFPTYAKIEAAVGKAERLIVNCAESEPYVTANHRLMLERPLEIINGTKILLKALGIRMAELAIEDNKLDAADKLAEKIGESKLLKIKVLRTKYPQGDERQLVYALTGRQIPAGKLPTDVGCVVFNAETCAAVYRAFAYGLPLIERVVTVAGDAVVTPKNVLAPIGATYKDLIDFCGGFKKKPRKMICGGPMMGSTIDDINSPIDKGTSAVLVFSEELAEPGSDEQVCIRCGRCIKSCPMHLMPNYLALFSREGRYEAAEEYDVMSCVECGACAYSCPGRVPIVQYIREAKNALCRK